MTYHNLIIPRTADKYQSRIWLDTLEGRAFCFLLLTTLDYKRDDSLRGSMDEYFWVIELNPLRQLFYYKTMAAGYKRVPERTQFMYIHNDEVSVARDTIWISNQLSNRVSAYGVEGDTISLVEERQAVNTLPTLLEM